MSNGGLHSITLLLGASVWLGCAASPAGGGAEPTASASVAPEPEPPPGPAPDEPVETGHACATATAACGGGSCTLKLKNDCEAPLTCAASMLLRCRTPTELVEAKGRERQTFPAKGAGEVVISANCTMGDPVQTSFTELKCQ